MADRTVKSDPAVQPCPSAKGHGPAPGDRVAVAVSGGGRSLENFLRAGRTAGAGYVIAAVIASRADCRGVEIARAAGLPVFIDPFPSGDQGPLAARLDAWLASHRIAWIALAGFLRPFPVHPLWAGKIVNIHPALLPAFGGKGMYGDRVHEAVLRAGASTTGATVHFVNERYDEGSIVAQASVPVTATDDARTLAARVFDAECRLYPTVLKHLISGALPLPQGRCWHLGQDGGPTP